MGEIDTKPIEPVQVALTLFGGKSDQRKQRHGNGGSSGDEMEKEKDIEELRKDLANYKVQLEAKDAAYLQVLHKLEQYQKTAEELSNKLKNSKLERDVLFEECKEATTRVDELEAKVKEMNDQILETGKLRDQLSHVLFELNSVQVELLSLETELAAAQEAKIKALTKAQLMETAANMEKERAEELLNNVFELNEALFKSKQAQKETEGKASLIQLLQGELNQANELLNSSHKAVSDVINDLNKLKSDLTLKERENSDQALSIRELETEMIQLKLELKNTYDEVTRLNCEIEMVTDELKTVQSETENRRMQDSNKKEIERMKKELEGAMAKVGELRTRAEQATTRAEAAERAKLVLEDQLRKWREQKQRRKAALAALREESLSREFASSSSYDNNDDKPRNYEPLGKVLNIKF